VNALTNHTMNQLTTCMTKLTEAYITNVDKDMRHN